MVRGLTTRLLARCLVLWLVARAMLASLGLGWLPAARTTVLLSLAVAAILLLDVLRRRERVLLANLGLSLPALYAMAALLCLMLEVAAAITFRALSPVGAA